MKKSRIALWSLGIVAACVFSLLVSTQITTTPREIPPIPRGIDDRGNSASPIAMFYHRLFLPPSAALAVPVRYRCLMIMEESPQSNIAQIAATVREVRRWGVELVNFHLCWLVNCSEKLEMVPVSTRKMMTLLYVPRVNYFAAGSKVTAFEKFSNSFSFRRVVAFNPWDEYLRNKRLPLADATIRAYHAPIVDNITVFYMPLSIGYKFPLREPDVSEIVESSALSARSSPRHKIALSPSWLKSPSKRKTLVCGMFNLRTGPNPRQNDSRAAANRVLLHLKANLRSKAVVNRAIPRWSGDYSPKAGYMNASYFRDVMEGSVFALAPCGNSPESFRLWEALESGCIPVLLRKSGSHDGNETGRLLTKLAPFVRSAAPFVWEDDYDSVGRTLMGLEEDWLAGRLDQWQMQIKQWYVVFKRETYHTLAVALTGSSSLVDPLILPS